MSYDKYYNSNTYIRVIKPCNWLLNGLASLLLDWSCILKFVIHIITNNFCKHREDVFEKRTSNKTHTYNLFSKCK